MNKCCVPGCPSSKSVANGVTLHRFPGDPVLLAVWLEAFPKKNFTPCEHSRVCSLHFKETDFAKNSQNKRECKKKLHLLTRRLLPQAVPEFSPWQEDSPAEEVPFSTYWELLNAVDGITLPEGTLDVEKIQALPVVAVFLLRDATSSYTPFCSDCPWQSQSL